MRPTKCPVCRSSPVSPFSEVERKTYWRCGHCNATFLDAEHHPAREDELSQYLLHENHVEDPSYRTFLSKLADPVLQRLADSAPDVELSKAELDGMTGRLVAALSESAPSDPAADTGPSTALAGSSDTRGRGCSNPETPKGSGSARGAPE